MPDYTHYFSSRKNPHHGEAVIEGFHAKRIPLEGARLSESGVHIVGGLQFGSLDLMIELRSNPKPYLFMDRAYFGGGPASNVLRIVPNAYQHNWLSIKDRGPRLKEPLVEEWKDGGKHIMVVPPSAAICLLFDLGDWLKDTMHTLSQITDREVYVSYKGDRQPLADRLKNCHAVVTWTSNVAVEAVCAGIPAIVSKHSAASPMCSSIELMDQHSIEHPKRFSKEVRQQWANALTWGQYTLDEIRDGRARRLIEAYAEVAV